MPPFEIQLWPMKGYRQYTGQRSLAARASRMPACMLGSEQVSVDMHASVRRLSLSGLHTPRLAPCITVFVGRPCRAASSSGASDSSSTTTTNPLTKFASANYLTQAARRYAAGVAAGIDEEELVALELGADSSETLTPLQQQYKGKVKQKLEQRAEELKAEEAAEELRTTRNLVLGKRRYERGEYPEAVAALEQAVKDAGESTNRGGEAQLWLALSYQAVGRDDYAIELLKSVEETHPSRKIKKQAYELRYIAEAPKLELGEDERVKIPLLQTDTWRAKERKSTFVPKYTPNVAKKVDTSKQTYWDRLDWRVPPGVSLGPDKWYYRLAWAILGLGTVIYLNWSYLHGSS